MATRPIFEVDDFKKDWKFEGRYSVKISIANIVFLLNTEKWGIYKILTNRYSGFLTNKKPEVEIDLKFSRDAVFRLRSRHRLSSFVFSGLDKGSLLFIREDLKGEFNLKRSHASVLINRIAAHTVDTVLRVCFSRYIVKKGGILVHSAGIIHGREGYVFFGKSGSGKSTLARRFSASSIVLSDEMVCVKREKGGFFVYGTPFWGMMEKGGVNSRARLKCLFLLRQSKINGLRDADKLFFINNFFKCIMFFGETKVLCNQILDLFKLLFSAVDFKVLYFRKDIKLSDILSIEGSFPK